MESAIRITWTRLIVGLICGVLLAIILLLRAAMPGPNVLKRQAQASSIEYRASSARILLTLLENSGIINPPKYALV